MESNNQFTPTVASEQPSQPQGRKPKATAAIIGILVGIAAVLFVVNGMMKGKPVNNGNVVMENVNSSTNQNVNALTNTNQLVVINANQQLLDQQPQEGVDYEIVPHPADRTLNIYRDKRYGFEVKYPATWKVTTNSGDFELVQFWKLSNDKTIIATDGQVQDSAKVSISLEKDSNLSELVENSRFDGTYGVKFVKEENLSINKMRAVQLFGSAETFGSITTVMNRGDGVFVVISGSYGFGEKELESQVIELSNSFRTL